MTRDAVMTVSGKKPVGLWVRRFLFICKRFPQLLSILRDGKRGAE